MMNRRFSRLINVFAVAAVLALLAGCAGGGAPAGDGDTGGAGGAPAAGSKDVSIAMWSSPNNFNPINTDSNYGFFAVDIAFDSLVDMDDEGRYVPKLAREWEWSDDFDVYTFHIDPDATWHDGEPVTAHDVAFTFRTIANPDTLTNRGAYINQISGTDANGRAESLDDLGVEVIDDHEVRFTLKGPADPLGVLEKLGTTVRIIPEHILGDVDPAELDSHELFMNPTVGSGPFKFVKYVTDQYIEFARYDDYYLGQPKLERLFVRIMPPTSAVAALEKGEIDMTAGPGVGEIPLQDWDKVEAMEGVEALTFVTKGYQLMDFNHTREHFHDPAVRQAFHHAINRRLMVDNLLKGLGIVQETPYTPIFRYVNEGLEFREHDPDKALEMLTEAGWDFDRELDLLVPTGNRVREQSADVIAANLLEIGVKVNIHKLDFPTLQSRRATGDYDMSLVGWSSLLDPDVSSQYRTGAPYNAGGYSNPTIDALLAEGIVTAEFEARKAIYDQFQEELYADPNFVILYSPYALSAVSEKLTDVELGPYSTLWNLHNWDKK